MAKMYEKNPDFMTLGYYNIFWLNVLNVNVNENFCRLKVTNFWLSDENYNQENQDSQKLRPTKFSPIRYYFQNNI